MCSLYTYWRADVVITYRVDGCWGEDVIGCDNDGGEAELLRKMFVHPCFLRQHPGRLRHPELGVIRRLLEVDEADTTQPTHDQAHDNGQEWMAGHS